MLIATTQEKRKQGVLVTLFFIFLNKELIQLFSKKQATIEMSVFGADFVAMKIITYTILRIRYNLRMMRVTISGPSYIYGDNMSVIHNTQPHESTLKKKSNFICYHANCESVAMGESLNGNVFTNQNFTDFFTKVLYGGKRMFRVSNFLYDVYDDL